MLLMYKLFTKNPSKSSLNTIINKLNQTLLFIVIDYKKNTKKMDELAKTNSYSWLSTKYEPTEECKRLIDNNFNEIIDDIDVFSKNRCSAEVRDIYLNLITEYDKKIRQVYQL
jgi:hypothetical protein